MVEIPEKKTLGFTFLGILLYIGSSYLNIQKAGSADFGLYFGIGLIILGTIAQIINWIKYWKKN